MQRLNLPEYDFRMGSEGDKTLIFDEIRKKFVVLTPEEWVRQNFIRFLVREKNYPVSLMSVEKQLSGSLVSRRFDLLVYRRNGHPFMIAEFKAPGVKISQETFDQVVRYNMSLKVEYILVSNGLQHFVGQVDYAVNRFFYLQEIPFFPEECRNSGQGFS